MTESSTDKSLEDIEHKDVRGHTNAQRRDQQATTHSIGITITAPTLRSDGTLLDLPGLDAATGLILQPGKWPHVPENPSRVEVEAAWGTLWEPLAEFPFISIDDRAVAVAALLTATVRRTLPKAPAFGFDAPAASGKTLLATSIAAVAGGAGAVVPERPGAEEEALAERLITLLLEGQPCVLLDDVTGSFASHVLEALLTNDIVQAVSQRANVLVLIAGHNFTPLGDLPRRVITARIGARVSPAGRQSFRLDPQTHCRENRQQIVAAALTLLRGFIAAGWPRFTLDRLVQFEIWDDLVRQCVLWLNAEGVARLGDPTPRST